MRNLPDDLSSVTAAIIGSAITVHQETGAGLLESVYKLCLAAELRGRGLRVEPECALPLIYRDVRLESAYRADMIVEKSVLIEVKAVESLLPVHQAQVITYLKISGCPVGLLFNFNVPVLRHGIRRMLHPALRSGVPEGMADAVPGVREAG
jgi:GxxExxY protein